MIYYLTFNEMNIKNKFVCNYNYFININISKINNITIIFIEKIYKLNNY